MKQIITIVKEEIDRLKEIETVISNTEYKIRECERRLETANIAFAENRISIDQLFGVIKKDDHKDKTMRIYESSFVKFSDETVANIIEEYIEYFKQEKIRLTNVLYNFKYNTNVDTPNLFTYGDKVQHIKTGNKYIIYNIPNNDDLLEDCHQPFYKYKEIDTNKKWDRAKDIMEDGRFILIY